MRYFGWAIAVIGVAALTFGVVSAQSEDRISANGEGFGPELAAAAEARTREAVLYDGSYQRIDFPMGDVSPNRGVCTDLVIRAYRVMGVDLQPLVHQDMKGSFRDYPKIWGLSRPDTNIDHRRVPNLETFLTRAGARLPLTDDPAAFQPGDLVTYRLAGGLPHIAVVADRRGWSGAPMIVHNIGAGPQLEDGLFAYEMVGHFRYHPGAKNE